MLGPWPDAEWVELDTYTGIWSTIRPLVVKYRGRISISLVCRCSMYQGVECQHLLSLVVSVCKWMLLRMYLRLVDTR